MTLRLNNGQSVGQDSSVANSSVRKASVCCPTPKMTSSSFTIGNLHIMDDIYMQRRDQHCQRETKLIASACLGSHYFFVCWILVSFYITN